MRWVLLPILAALAGCASNAPREAAPPMAVTVDHVTLCGSNLQQMRDTFAAAGIETEYGGKHANGITEMALSSFPDGSYLELIAPLAGVDPTAHYWARYMTGRAGPCGWALRSTDLDSDTARMAAAGIAIARDKGGRQRPDGAELRWETATVGPAPQGSFFPFLIHDQTDRDLRAYPQDKPTMTSIAGVRSVVVGTGDLNAAVAQYRQAFGLPEPAYGDEPRLGAQLARFPGTPIVLAAPTSEGGWLAQRQAQFGEIPAAFLLASPNQFPGEPSSWFGEPVTWLNAEGAQIGVVK